jgi:hypothetical protein
MKQQNFHLQPFTLISQNLQIHGNIRRENNILAINYLLQGELGNIYIPTPADKPTRKHELWTTTCLEFFLGIKHSPRYWEFNLSPSGDWNIYRFDDYRQGMEEETAMTSLPFTVRCQPESLQLSLELDLEQFIPLKQNLDVAITAVIRDSSDVTTYWALKHCGEKADFHLRDSFMIELI